MIRTIIVVVTYVGTAVIGSTVFGLVGEALVFWPMIITLAEIIIFFTLGLLGFGRLGS